MSVSTESLHIRHLRPGMLYARDWPGRWVPLVLLGGLAVWMTAVIGMYGLILPGVTAALFIVSLGAFLIAPLLMTRGCWLVVDLTRGWIHCRRRWGRRVMRDSFAPNRLTVVSIDRIRTVIPGVQSWRVLLSVDHPRLGRVELGRFWRRHAAERTARELAQVLGLSLKGVVEYDPKDVEMLSRPDLRTASAQFSKPAALPAPPEVAVSSIGPDTRLMLPNMSGLTRETASFLAYSIVWCLWSWTSLAFQIRPILGGAVPTVGQQLTLALLVMISLLGLWLLHGTMVKIAGAQTLEQNRDGVWWYCRRWLGLDWQRRRLNLGTGTWIRRIDQPAGQSGLWLFDGGEELHLAPGLETDTLAWLQQTLIHPGRPCEFSRGTATTVTDLNRPPDPQVDPQAELASSLDELPETVAAHAAAQAVSRTVESAAGPDRPAKACPTQPASDEKPSVPHPKGDNPPKPSPKKNAPLKDDAPKAGRGKSKRPTAPKDDSKASAPRSVPKSRPLPQ